VYQIWYGFNLTSKQIVTDCQQYLPLEIIAKKAALHAYYRIIMQHDNSGKKLS
jgi:hypothetical protein